MPCRVDPIYVNRSKENKQIMKVADRATKELDRIREAILAGRTPNYTYAKTVEKLIASLPNDASPPYEGVVLNASAAQHLRQLYAEFAEYIFAEHDLDRIRSRQEKHRRQDITRLRIEFAKRGDDEALRKTLNVDYSKPLAPQLGYDPDDL